MRCSHSHKLIEKYLDNSLNEKDTVSLRSHLSLCAECGDYLADARALHSALDCWEDVFPSRSFNDLMERIDNSEVVNRDSMLLIPKWALAGMAAASIMIGVAAGYNTREQYILRSPEEHITVSMELASFGDVVEGAVAYNLPQNQPVFEEGEIK